MKLVKDLGMSYATSSSKTKRRFGLYECPWCLTEFKACTYDVNNGKSTRCRACVPPTYGATKHGCRHHPLYTRWLAMNSRCYNVKDKDYPNYGGKGVTVCKTWRDNPQVFIKWAEANGYEKHLTIDKDELSNILNISPATYSPDTCQFITLGANVAISNKTRHVRV